MGGRHAPERRRPSWRATRRGTHARPPLGALGLGPAAACWPLSCRLRAAGAQAPPPLPPLARGAAPAALRQGPAGRPPRGPCRPRARASAGPVTASAGRSAAVRPTPPDGHVQTRAGCSGAAARLHARERSAARACVGEAGMLQRLLRPPPDAICAGRRLMAPPRALPPAPRALKPRAVPSGRPCRGAQQRVNS